jgi:hypothetical protein
MKVLPLAVALAVAPVFGHHSLTEYDSSRRVTLDAVVREFHFVNPHPYLLVDGRVGAASQMWRLELDNRFELVDIGMTSRTFARGDQLVVSGAPGRDDMPILYVRQLDRPADGLRYEQVGSSPRIQPRTRGVNRQR